MIQWLFLNGVDTETAGTAVGGKHDGVILAFAHVTQALLAFPQFTGAGADIALNAAVVKLVPVPGGVRPEQGLIHDAILSADSLTADNGFMEAGPW